MLLNDVLLFSFSGSSSDAIGMTLPPMPTTEVNN